MRNTSCSNLHVRIYNALPADYQRGKCFNDAKKNIFQGELQYGK